MAAGAMYKMKPICEDTSIADALPTCMYKMKNFHEDVDGDTFMECPQVQELMQRQLAVFNDLEKLKAEIDQISSDIGLGGLQSDGSSSKPKVSSCMPVSIKEPSSIVVSASPSDPPLSLFVMQKMLQCHGLACCTVAHCHSSLTSGIPEYLRDIFARSDACATSTGVCLRIIWKKEILTPSLILSVADQSPILGEANILRYLCRLFMPHLYDNLGSLQMANVDTWLNAALRHTTSENAKEGKAFIKLLNDHLEKHNWLVGSAPSLADIYCSIVLLKKGRASSYPSNVQSWINSCRKNLHGFQDLEKMCK